ncbi:MAG: hypothetical protein N4A74_14910 [Carboxylicivirga sp.]|jgi:hypothetical protein|nr:hypothetical protein [Carboxylicivirga sp.]
MIKYIVLLFVFSSAFCKAQTNYYVSSVGGDDTNDGSEANPFKTIRKANEVLAEGGTCFLMQGIYRETVTVPTNNVTYKNYQDDYVVITGLDMINNWTHDRGHIYKAVSLDSITQVFVNGQRMNWARLPNEDGNMFSRGDLATLNFQKPFNVTDPKNPIETPKAKAIFTANDLPSFSKDFFKGGYIVGVGDKKSWWSSSRGRVIASHGNELTCTDLNWLWIRDKFTGDCLGYVIGIKNAIDHGKEWAYENGELFLQPDNGVDLNQQVVEGRTRLVAFDLSNKSNVKLEGLHIKAGNILMPEASNCTVLNCTVKYGTTFSNYDIGSLSQLEEWGDYKYRDAAISIGGANNVIRACYIGDTWGTGISLWGDFNTVDNNIIYQTNWQAARRAPVSILGDDNKVINNSVKDTGRDGIEMGHATFVGAIGDRATINNNTIENVAWYCPDSGYLYVNHAGSKYPDAGTEIAYNIMDGYQSPQYYTGHGGIYLDSGSSGYLIHHNVFMNCKTGLHVNERTMQHYPHAVYVYNNTGINVDKISNHNFNPVTAAKEKEGISSKSEVVAINNISTKSNDNLATVKRNNYKISNAELVDITNGDFQLKKTSMAIDAGEEIPGITDGFTGAAPDAGAFEFGLAPWEAGASISVPEFWDELVLKKLIEGERITQKDIEDAKKAEATRWQTNSDKWVVSNNSATNQAASVSLEAANVRAYRQIFDLHPYSKYTMFFDYEISNVNGENAGVKVSIHEGEFTNSDYANLAVKTITTELQSPESEEGVGSIGFTPTGHTVYAIFHKVGSGGKRANARVANLSFAISTSSKEIDQESDFQIITVNKSFVVRGARLEKVYNMSGQEVRNSNLNSGIYIVKVSYNSIVDTQKALIN